MLALWPPLMISIDNEMIISLLCLFGLWGDLSQSTPKKFPGSDSAHVSSSSTQRGIRTFVVALRNPRANGGTAETGKQELKEASPVCLSSGALHVPCDVM